MASIATGMRHPLQRIEVSQLPGSEGQEVLLAAAGPRLAVFNLRDGASLSTWDGALSLSQEQGAKETLLEAQDAIDGTQEPPEKKRKLSPAPSGKSNKIRSSKNGPAKDAGPTPLQPNIIALVAIRSKGLVVVVTGEDKGIRLFQLGAEGELQFLNERFMPKRPVAVRVTDDLSTILCADKFGDVYSLPLLPTEPRPLSSPAESSAAQSPTPSRSTRPSANDKTVHTKGNLEALQQQLRSQHTPHEKPKPNFEHKLLLGHVSMLTDMLCHRLDGLNSPSGQKRDYIITSDRDEHIRVSRGIPQTHVIEGFCLGHQQFVSRMCIPKGRPRVLISGGGDDYLLVWDWVAGRILQKMDLRETVGVLLEENGKDISQVGRTEVLATALDNTVKENGVEANGQAEMNSEIDASDGPRTQRKIAITGIWDAPSLSNDTTSNNGTVLVACEGIPALFCFTFNEDADLRYTQTLALDGNALDLAVQTSESRIIVSVDSIHEPFDTRSVRPSSSAINLQAFALHFGAWVKDPGYKQVLQTISSHRTFDMNDAQASRVGEIQSLLYTVEVLRKRTGEE